MDAGARERRRRRDGRITWSDAGAVVSAASAEIAVDRVALAVPASVVNRIEFDPPLPASLRSAYAAVGYGNAAKLFVPLAETPPTSAVLSVPERYWTWTATAADGVLADDAVFKDWDADPWVAAAYSCDRPETSAWASAGPLHVCGEHTCDGKCRVDGRRAREWPEGGRGDPRERMSGLVSGGVVAAFRRLPGLRPQTRQPRRPPEGGHQPLRYAPRHSS